MEEEDRCRESECRLVKLDLGFGLDLRRGGVYVLVLPPLFSQPRYGKLYMAVAEAEVEDWILRNAS